MRPNTVLIATNIDQRSNRMNSIKKLFTFISCMMLMLMLVTSCEHDPVGPIDPGPGPIDTTGNPIDTTGNPIDTTDHGTPCDPNVVYFEMSILPLLKSNCAKSGCHDAITHEEGIVLD